MKKDKKYIPHYEKIEVSKLVSKLLVEINSECIPLFNRWFDLKTEDFTTFNSIRILTPLIEIASEIEFSMEPHKLLEVLNIPQSKVAWFMFRHGLAHSIIPYNVIYQGKKYKWGVGQGSLGKHCLATDNCIVIYPKQILDDLIIYLEGFKYNKNFIDIQTSVTLNR